MSTGSSFIVCFQGHVGGRLTHPASLLCILAQKEVLLCSKVLSSVEVCEGHHFTFQSWGWAKRCWQNSQDSQRGSSTNTLVYSSYTTVTQLLYKSNLHRNRQATMACSSGVATESVAQCWGQKDALKVMSCEEVTSHTAILTSQLYFCFLVFYVYNIW